MNPLTESPVFDTRADAETYAEDLAMKGYEHSMGYDVRVERVRDGYAVRMTRNRHYRAEA